MLNRTTNFLINLPERVERYEEAKKEIIPFLNDRPLIVIDGVIDTSPHIGIAKAHQNCVYVAEQCLSQYALIMEDDIHFLPGAKEYANEAFNNVPEDWDILLGGVYSSDKLTPYNDYWNKTGEFSGLHFYVVHAKAYDKILNFNYKSHIDRFMASPLSGLNCYVAKKFFAIQKPGHSDNVGMYKDYSELLTKFELL